MKTTEFDAACDKGEDITGVLDPSKAQRPRHQQRRINVDCPVWVIESLDREADRIGVTRQSLIKVWLTERLEKLDTREGQPEGQPERATAISCEKA